MLFPHLNLPANLPQRPTPASGQRSRSIYVTLTLLIQTNGVYKQGVLWSGKAAIYSAYIIAVWPLTRIRIRFWSSVLPVGVPHLGVMFQYHVYVMFTDPCSRTICVTPLLSYKTSVLFTSVLLFIVFYCTQQTNWPVVGISCYVHFDVAIWLCFRCTQYTGSAVVNVNTCILNWILCCVISPQLLLCVHCQNLALRREQQMSVVWNAFPSPPFRNQAINLCVESSMLPIQIIAKYLTDVHE